MMKISKRICKISVDTSTSKETNFPYSLGGLQNVWLTQFFQSMSNNLQAFTIESINKAHNSPSSLIVHERLHRISGDHNFPLKVHRFLLKAESNWNFECN